MSTERCAFVFVAGLFASAVTAHAGPYNCAGLANTVFPTAKAAHDARVACDFESAPIANMHDVFFTIGQTLQHNAVNHQGPVKLAEYPLDPASHDFWVNHTAQAHTWAMEGVNYAAGNGTTDDIRRAQLMNMPASVTPAPVAAAPVATSAPEGCSDETAQAMWDVANSMGCPGYWNNGYHAEPFNRMVARMNCETRRATLYKQAWNMSCTWICNNDMAHIYLQGKPICSIGEARSE